MNQPTARLQFVWFACEFPDSPLYQERIGQIVARRLRNFKDWERTENGFALLLGDRGEERGIRFSPGALVAKDESLTPSSFGELLTSLRVLLTEILSSTEVLSITSVAVHCIFFVPHDSPLDLVNKVNSIFLKELPAAFVDQFGRPIEIGVPTYSFVLPEDGLVSFAVKVVHSSILLKSLFPETYESCEPGGLSITVDLSYTAKPIEQLDKIFGMLEKQPMYISEIILKGIYEAESR